MIKALKKTYSKTGSSLCGFVNKFKKYKVMHYSPVQVLLLSFITTFVVECLSKFSIWKTVKWMFTHPLIFLVNMAIVSIIYGVAVCFRRKYFFYALAAFIWLVLGVTNCIVTLNRTTPFTAGDLLSVVSVHGIFSKYLNGFEFAMIIIGVTIAVALLVNCYFKLPINKAKFSYPKKILTAVAIMAVSYGYVCLAMSLNIIAVNFVNLRNAYRDYGFAYCFSNSVVNTGINKPNGYSKNTVNNIIENIATDGQANKPSKEPGNMDNIDDMPNVIFVQLESFFNVNRLQGVEFVENPIPTMTDLYENYSTGFLNVPSISAGTANTEFEVLTGMNMDDFGPGEYPFNTILSKNKTTESIAYDLKEYGYSTHGLHNNTAGFYNRKIVYPNLGIDTFTSIEYMVNAEKNQLGWAKDYILTTYIAQALDSTEGRDFVFTVSVQGHGAYPDEDILEDDSLLVSLDGIEGDVGEFNFAYYLEQISEMDEFVSELISYLSVRNEKTVLVLYGDHLPGFEFSESDLAAGTLYDTEYVIWSNYELTDERVVKDMPSYELGSYVLSLLGYDSGLINKLHQKKDIFSEEDYLMALKTLEYDMLYGDMNCWDGVNPYIANPVKYGYKDIEITDIEVIADPDEKDYYYLTVTGNNFTTYSKVFINEDNRVKTIYLDEHTLFVPGLELKSGDSIVISQSSTSITTLSCTAPYYCTNESLGLEKTDE
ncbi:MAG: LTA synthase family protein [Lachnospiraceae bacterium]